MQSLIRLASLEVQSAQHATYFLLAGDEVNGRGWGVTGESVPKNIHTFVGQPFVITSSEYIAGSPYGKIYDHPSTEHFDVLGIAPKGSFNVNDIGLIKKFQEKFAIADIRKVYEKGDVWRADVTKRAEYANVPWPPFCSPAIYKVNPHERDGQITKWFGLHLAGLDQRPAYGNIAILKATCDGPYESCEHHLKTASLGAVSKITPCRINSLIGKIKLANFKLATTMSQDLSDTQILNLAQFTVKHKKRKMPEIKYFKQVAANKVSPIAYYLDPLCTKPAPKTKNGNVILDYNVTDAGKLKVATFYVKNITRSPVALFPYSKDSDLKVAIDTEKISSQKVAKVLVNFTPAEGRIEPLNEEWGFDAVIG